MKQLRHSSKAVVWLICRLLVRIPCPPMLQLNPYPPNCKPVSCRILDELVDLGAGFMEPDEIRRSYCLRRLSDIRMGRILPIFSCLALGVQLVVFDTQLVILLLKPLSLLLHCLQLFIFFAEIPLQLADLIRVAHLI
jgi:hypothetical protein